MPRFVKKLESSVKVSARMVQMCSMFEISPDGKTAHALDLPMDHDDRPWSIGLIVGPSGSGKSTVGRDIFGGCRVSRQEWSADRAVIDDVAAGAKTSEVCAALSHVGFSSPPAWMRPFRLLSGGEQFRAGVARAVLECGKDDICVVDEFTSVVDRQVAQVGSSAIAKMVRAQGKRLVAISCHYDIIDWLQPDWVLYVDERRFEWRCVQRRPEIQFTISMVASQAWDIFSRHHYLSHEINPSSRCFVASVHGEPVAFASVLSFPHPTSPGWRGHRTVCLPDWQGVGIGNALSNYVASIYAATGKPYRSTTAHPAMTQYRAKHPHWDLKKQPGLSAKVGASSVNSFGRAVATNRSTASFEWVGPKNVADARAFGLIK